MTRLLWDKVSERFFETGVDRGVLFPKVGAGVAWNGLISVDEKPSGGALSEYYQDGVKFLDFVTGEDFAATLEAFSAPFEFNACDGTKQLANGLFATQQPREPFGFSYRTLVGNDVEGQDFGYKLHLVWNSTALPAGRPNKTVSDKPDPVKLQWDISTIPVMATDRKPTAHLVVDSTKAIPAKLTQLENALYGTVSTAPYLPTQAQVITMLTGP